MHVTSDDEQLFQAWETTNYLQNIRWSQATIFWGVHDDLKLDTLVASHVKEDGKQFPSRTVLPTDIATGENRKYDTFDGTFVMIKKKRWNGCQSRKENLSSEVCDYVKLCQVIEWKVPTAWYWTYIDGRPQYRLWASKISIWSWYWNRLPTVYKRIVHDDD